MIQTAPPPSAPSLPLRLAQVATWLLLAYWAVVAVVFPVMIWDAHTYNLARIEIARLDGLFCNRLWLGERQVYFPWAFDALHLPAILAGFGYGIPSFLCLLGTIVGAQHILRRRVGRAAAIWTALALAAMPTLVYQAVSSKNDIPLLFAVAAWAVALDAWLGQPRARWLWMMAAAIGFGVGAKSAGVPLGFLMGLATLVVLRRDWRRAAGFSAACVVMLLLLGSVETYVNNLRECGAALGPKWFVEMHANRDGVRGVGANALRYVAGNLNLGLELFRPHPDSYVWLEQGVERLLARLGWSGAGCRPGFETPQFLKNGGEAGSDFGLSGTLAMLACAGALVTFRWRTAAFRLAVAALGALLLVALTTAWMPWNARFLLVPFALGAVVLGLIAGAREKTGIGHWLLLVVLSVSGGAAVVQSAHRHPGRIIPAITDRDRVMTSERPAMHEIVLDLRARAAELHDGVLLHSGSDSWVFAAMHRMPFPVTPLPQLDGLEHLAERRARHLLILDKALPALDPQRFTVVHRYPHSETFLVRINGPAPSP